MLFPTPFPLQHSPPPPSKKLVLMQAAYLQAGPRVVLGFDRAIDIRSLDGSQITVVDGLHTSLSYVATGAADLVDPQTVRIVLNDIGPATGIGVTLTASAATGIIARDDGGTWPGVAGLILPWP